MPVYERFSSSLNYIPVSGNTARQKQDGDRSHHCKYKIFHTRYV